MVAVAVVTGAKVTPVDLAMMMEALVQSLVRALVVGLVVPPLLPLLMTRTGELCILIIYNNWTHLIVYIS